MDPRGCLVLLLFLGLLIAATGAGVISVTDQLTYHAPVPVQWPDGTIHR